MWQVGADEEPNPFCLPRRRRLSLLFCLFLFLHLNFDSLHSFTFCSVINWNAKEEEEVMKRRLVQINQCMFFPFQS